MNGQPQNLPPVIGLTGGVGSGKSLLAHQLEKLGCALIEADRLGHAVIAPDGEAYAELVALFGPRVVTANGTLDRGQIAAQVFSDPEKLAALNRATHPAIAARIAALAMSYKERPNPPRAIVVEAAVLFEAGWDKLCDTCWTVSVAPAVALERLIQQGRMSPEQAKARMKAQWSNRQREARAAHTLRNDGPPEELLAQAKALLMSVAG